MRNFIQGLESRLFLSVCPTPSVAPKPATTATKPDATITADLNAVKTDETAVDAAFKKLQTDQAALGKAVQTALGTTAVKNAQTALTQLPQFAADIFLPRAKSGDSAPPAGSPRAKVDVVKTKPPPASW